MPRRSEHTFRERQFGRELRRLRKALKLNLKDVSKAVGFDHRKVSRIERGQLPNYHEMVSMLVTYRVGESEWPGYTTMLERARERGWWCAYGVDRQGFVSLENEACLVYEFDLGLVPELLQTEAYARAIFARSRHESTPEQLDLAVAVRLRRQQRLTVGKPLRYHVIIDESVLTEPRLAPALMRAQLRHITRMAALPTITVQVMPRAAGPHDGRTSSFTVLEFADDEDVDVLYVEHVGGAADVDNEATVRSIKALFGDLTKLALSPDASARMIERLTARL
ncbi:helix-turn-helix domain-containing protein [Solihabitans fulvus]|uniref:Helix-turn-helix domain-containing protein n=1 Tax=Solihabitans fulvus TaxID=1892852 RepID=A0A5B2XPL7_9PSEU|nr:helix-turn-helix transcriptional regulator [Solihabitans fulvus]KAA2264812.1 helix-turn-helix domain-containing protein [Solihabitans fulvus]